MLKLRRWGNFKKAGHFRDKVDRIVTDLNFSSYDREKRLVIRIISRVAFAGFEVDEEYGDVGRTDAGDTRCMTDGAGTDLR